MTIRTRMTLRRATRWGGIALLLCVQAGRAEVPEVVDAWREGAVIHVTLAHPDTGWDHYADGWEVLGLDGTRVGLRVLTHPHATEQPFTRSLRLEQVPAGPLRVRARCSRDGWGSATTPVREN